MLYFELPSLLLVCSISQYWYMYIPVQYTMHLPRENIFRPTINITLNQINTIIFYLDFYCHQIPYIYHKYHVNLSGVC